MSPSPHAIAPQIPQDLDGFRIEIDAARERAAIDLARPPRKGITMPERDQ